MERSSKRGKIPQRDWPSIMARHEAGETLASIARTYDCSPPAISYIVSRSRARSTAAQGASSASPSIGEPQLIKTHGSEAPAASAVAVSERQPVPSEAQPAPVLAEASPPLRPLLLNEPERPAPRPVAEHAPRAPEPRAELRPRDGNGNAGRQFAGPSEVADSRRTLHLSLGAGTEPAPQPQAAERQPLRQPPMAPPMRPAPGPAGPAAAPPVRTAPEPPKTRDGGGIDRALRERVEGDIAAFLRAFDAALVSDTSESRAGLREATDRLLRAGARTRIELERLEARVPLPSRERRDQESLEWRHR
jgi:hypothetical protein